MFEGYVRRSTPIMAFVSPISKRAAPAPCAVSQKCGRFKFANTTTRECNECASNCKACSGSATAL